MSTVANMFDLEWPLSVIEGEIPLVTYCILSLLPCQLSLRVSNKQPFGPIDQNTQRHRAVSLRPHSFLVIFGYTENSRNDYLLQQRITTSQQKPFHKRSTQIDADSIRR